MESSALTEALRETLALFDEGGSPRTTTEVADLLDLGRRSTYERLERLVERGQLDTKKVGGNGRVWWQPADPAATATPDWEAAAESLVGDVLDDAEVGVFVLDADFQVAWVNQATEQYFGLDRSEVVGRDKRRLVDEQISAVVEDSTTFADTVLATYDDNTYTERFECHITAGDGREERWLEHRSKPIETGAYAGGRVELYYDVTDRKRGESAHRTDRKQFESLVDAVEEYAIVLLDADGRVRTWNAGAARIKGYDADDIVGEHFSTFYTAEDQAEGVPTENLARAAKEGGIEDEGWRVRADGSRFWANVTITPIRNDDGEIEGYAKVTRDMTGRREQERALRRERDLVDRLFDIAPVRLAVFDVDANVQRVNSRVREDYGIDDGADASFDIDELTLYNPDGTRLDRSDHPVRRVIETGDPVTDRLLQYEPQSGERQWVSLTATPLFDGGGDVERVVVAGNDVTELKRKEREIARQRDELGHELDEVFQRVDDAFYAVDNEFRFRYVNDRAEQLLGAPESALLGQTVWDALGVDGDDDIRERLTAAMETQEPTSFERYSEPLGGIWEIVRIYPSESGLSVYFSDITERKQRERELEESEHRYRTLIENFPHGAVTLVDEACRYVMAGGTAIADADFTMDDLIGGYVAEVLPDGLADLLAPKYEAALEGEPSMFEQTMGDKVYQFRVLPVRDDDGEIFAAMGMMQDVTEQKEYERYLEDAKSQLEAATEAGAVGTFEWHVQEDQMFTGSSFADMFGVDPYAAREGVSLDRFIEAIHGDDRERVEAEMEAALEACSEYEVEYRVRNADGEYRWVVARGRVECDADGTPVTFPGTLTDITDRKEVEIELEQRRQQLEALNELNEVVHEITGAVIDQSSREEIETIVCERLAATDSYQFAWVGDVDVASETVNLRTEAGVEGYLDDITITVDPDDERSDGPAGRALRTGTIQTTQNIHDDGRHDPWRGKIREYSFRSVASIPIVHENTTYGVLNVYAERPAAFEGEELDVIEQIGEIVGHAIAAVERKRALLSDEVVELEFHIEDAFESFGVDASEAPPIYFDHTVPIDDQNYVLFGRTTSDGVDTVERMVESIPFYDDVTFRDEDEWTVFELRVSEPPVLSTIASLGGSISEAAIEGGDYRLTVHLSPSVDVRQVTELISEQYPAAKLLKRRQRTVRENSDPTVPDVMAALTPRQRATLETALHAGFFEWPRESSGEEVASLLDVSPPTFHQHLRKAEQKVFESLLSSATPAQ